MNVKLIISDPRKSDSKDILLGEGEYLIGRESKCDICIKNTSVSREHAWLIISGQDVAIQDMRSSWGTFIDGIQIMGEVPILAGQSLKIGEVSIDLELHSAEDSGAPALSLAGQSRCFSQTSNPLIPPALTKPPSTMTANGIFFQVLFITMRTLLDTISSRLITIVQIVP